MGVSSKLLTKSKDLSFILKDNSFLFELQSAH